MDIDLMVYGAVDRWVCGDCKTCKNTKLDGWLNSGSKTVYGHSADSFTRYKWNSMFSSRINWLANNDNKHLSGTKFHSGLGIVRDDWSTWKGWGSWFVIENERSVTWDFQGAQQIENFFNSFENLIPYASITEVCHIAHATPIRLFLLESHSHVPQRPFS